MKKYLLTYLQVVKISLQCTLLQRWEGNRIPYPNTKCSTEPIMNVSRSANRWETERYSCAHRLSCNALNLFPMPSVLQSSVTPVPSNAG